MGVTGLLPFLKKATEPVNVSQLAGKTVAIDAYVWLHRGAFSCADRLARGEKTLGFIGYGQKMLNMLLANKIKPILVFDGRRLKAKEDTEKKRHESRKQNKEKAEELMRAGRVSEARDYLRRSVDVNHSMAIELIKLARRLNVDYIVAPHEADAQLAFLNRQGIAQAIITEDSDLILFGCTQILYKLDINGNGFMVRADKLHLTLNRPHESPEHLLTKLRQICILSGCDYVSSLPGVGLVKAKKFVMATSDPDFLNAIKRLPSFLNLKTKVDEEYIKKVANADLTFQKQLVFDPRKRRLATIDGQEIGTGPFSGTLMSDDDAFQLAIGNIDPHNMHKMANFDMNNMPSSSIWSGNFTMPDLRYDGPVTAFVTTPKPVLAAPMKPPTPKPKMVARPSTWMLDLELTSLYSTKPEGKLKSEVECRVGDEVKVCSTYFSSEAKEDSEMKTPQSQSLIQQIENSPTKQSQSDPGRIASNPFARKSSVPLSPIINRYTLDGSTPTSVRSPFKSTPAQNLDSGLSSLDETDPTSQTDESSFSDLEYSDLAPLKPNLSRIKFRKPLFNKSSDVGSQALNSPVKSPIIYKRKRNENLSPFKKRLNVSKYFCDSKSIMDHFNEDDGKDIADISESSNNVAHTPVFAPVPRSNGVDRKSAGGPARTPELKKKPKVDSKQFSLLTFGFSKN
ncbi:Hypothetical predicted protein [Cloeon dipterum]|uniref:Exonuclease 1 n=4 Tax=Cloeon dipterum TaxID=197152 RepID=A0A8S1CF47_9INSE|nr:Hypothetical predicted protein [Cloeon dipterum]